MQLLPLRLLAGAIGSILALQVVTNDQTCSKTKVKHHIFWDILKQIVISNSFAQKEKKKPMETLPFCCLKNCTPMDYQMDLAELGSSINTFNLKPFIFLAKMSNCNIFYSIISWSSSLFCVEFLFTPIT